VNRAAADDRIPPQSLEMEQAVLGSMLIERAAIDRVRAVLRPADFYRDAHRVIYEAILALSERDEPVDLLTLQEQLKRQEALDTIGGTPYLVQLMDAVASAANAGYYAGRVEETAILRRLIGASSQIREMAHQDFESITLQYHVAGHGASAVAALSHAAYSDRSFSNLLSSGALKVNTSWYACTMRLRSPRRASHPMPSMKPTKIDRG